LEYLGEFKVICKNALDDEIGAQRVMFDGGKSQGSKSRETISLSLN
jgi:hypothetical protein